MKQAFLFLSDKSDQWIVSKFNSLTTSENSRIDAFFLYHAKNQIIPEIISKLNHYVFTDEILHGLRYTPIRNTLLPGSNHFPLLKFYLENQQYDYYWLIEDDVFFNGSWKILFEAYQNDSVDFIASHIKKYAEDPYWSWWGSLYTGHEELHNKEKVRSFNPIYRLSNKALKCIDIALKNGWIGHHEVLIPTLLYNRGFTISDMGGNGNFVPNGFENRFYTGHSMSHLPVKPSEAPDCIYHSVKEKKPTDLSLLKRNCVISAVGRNSLHREWIKGIPDFDLHLIVYDDSFNRFYEDADFICSQRGYKLKLIYNYLQRNPEYTERYDYFFFPDDDIRMDTENISKLFRIMREYELQIAQPALSDSYYTYEHTMRDRFCVLRYTNFVEMMLPCFSREALRKVLFSFDENESGWGVDFHWPQLIGFSGKEMGVIDALHAIHTRPVQSQNWKNQKELNAYTQKYQLSRKIIETGVVLANLQQINESAILKTDRETYNFIEKSTKSIADRFFRKTYPLDYPVGFSGLVGASFFLVNYYRMSGKRKYLDQALRLVDESSARIILIKEDLNFITGLPGFSWYIEYLAQHGFIENNTDEILEVICEQLNSCFSKEVGISELINLGFHYLARMKNPSRSNKKTYEEEKEIMIQIINAIGQWLENLSEKKLDEPLPNIITCAVLLCQAQKTIALPGITLILSRIIKEIEIFDGHGLPHFLKSDLLYIITKDPDKEEHEMFKIKIDKLFNIYILKMLYSLINIDELSHSKSTLSRSQEKCLEKDWELIFLGFIIERINGAELKNS